MHITYTHWGDATGFGAGTFHHARTDNEALALDPTADRGTWVSPVVQHGFAATELVASWNADTPPGCWIEVLVAGTTDNGEASPDYLLGRWASGEEAIARTTVTGQRDRIARVDYDTLIAAEGVGFESWQITVRLHREAGSAGTPRVRLVGVMTSALPRREDRGVSAPTGVAGGAELPVPPYSQQVHRGRLPEYNGGGEAWCSPTSTAMVVAYWGGGPTAADWRWLAADYPDPQVAHAARGTYDAGYHGTGNWPFNTAYAAGYRAASGAPLTAFVTRLRSLAEAEAFIAAGIPLIASVAFTAAELTGAGYHTNGHLLVIIGFTDGGDVVVNDPASHLEADNGAVRTTYDRAEFERAWVDRTGGIVYVIHPVDVPLPAAPVEPNW